MLIRPGEHTYVFRYRTGRQIRWFDGKPELNWNVTGNFWRFPIRSRDLSPATCRRRRARCAGPPLPAGSARAASIGKAIVGPLGTLTVSTTRRLAPGEGLTVVAELPAGAVEPPSANTLLWYQLFDNRQWIIGGVGFLVVLIYYFAAWNAVGRDPKRGTIIPLFHPPQGISPALANYIHNWGLGAREMARLHRGGAVARGARARPFRPKRGKALTLKTTGKQPEGGFASLPAGEGAILQLGQ